MRLLELDARIEAVKLHAQGRWTEVLRALNVGEHVVSGKRQPCPLSGCLGAGQFQYTDAMGMGDYHCSRCGPGGGLKLLQALQGGSLLTLLAKVEAYLGLATEVTPEAPASKRSKDHLLAQEILAQCLPVRAGDEVDRYFRARGLGMATYPESLRCHQALPFYHRDGDSGASSYVCSCAALVAVVEGQAGSARRLLRLYLQDGAPAFAGQSEKMLGEAAGGAVRLAPAAQTLAVTVSLCDGLAVLLRTGQAVWCALSEANLQRLWLPEGVQRLRIYGSNSTEFRAQEAAFQLARRWRQYGKQVETFIPRRPGGSWAEVWANKAQHLRSVA